MYLTIHIGTWLFPVLFTVIMLGWALLIDWKRSRQRLHNYGHGLPVPNFDLAGLVRWAFAVIVVLCAWVAWLAPVGTWSGAGFAAIVCVTAFGIWWGGRDDR